MNLGSLAWIAHTDTDPAEIHCRFPCNSSLDALVSHLSVTSPSQVTLITLFACAAVAAKPRARLATGIAASTRLSSFASHPPRLCSPSSCL